MAANGHGPWRRKRRKSARQAGEQEEIEIRRIADDEKRQVCFSQRRGALIKNAMELCMLSGAQLAVIVFSPSGKAYSFTHPSMNTVIERYFNTSAGATAASEATSTWPAMLSEFGRLREALEAEAHRRDELEAAALAAGVWTIDDVHTSGMTSLVDMLAALERIKAEVEVRAHEIIAEKVMIHQYAVTGGGSDDAFGYDHYDTGDGSFTADGGGASTSGAHGLDTLTMPLPPSPCHLMSLLSLDVSRK